MGSLSIPTMILGVSALLVASRIIVKRAVQIPPVVRRSIVETLDACIFAAVLSLVIITFVVQAFYIPSGSMEPTLMVNDRILVANGRGATVKANPQGPNPLLPKNPTVREYIAGLYRGTLSIKIGRAHV